MSALVERRYSSLDDFEREFRVFLKDSYGPGFHVSKTSRSSDNLLKYSVANSVPEIIDDAKSGTRLVRFHNYDSIFVADVLLQEGAVRVTIPDRDLAYQEVVKALQSVTIKSEGALLKTVHERLVNIPLVDTALTPIREIIKTLHRGKEVLVKDFARGRGEPKALRYLGFLEGLDFVRRAGPGRYVPGLAFYAHEKKWEHEASMYDAILAQVLRQGYDYLIQYLRLSQIVPFIRASNTYFLPARLTNRLLYMDYDDFRGKYTSYYGKPRTAEKLMGHVDQIRRVEVFDPDEREYIVADKSVFRQYLGTPLALP